MSEKEKINSEGLKNVSGGSNVGVPNPYPFKCPKCGKSFGMTEMRVGCGGYCMECQEKYPEELPINDPKSPLGRLVNNRRLNESQEKEVTGGVILSRGHKCKKCGKEFDTVLPNNWMNPTGRGGVIPENSAVLIERMKEHEMRINYCDECLKEMKK